MDLRLKLTEGSFVDCSPPVSETRENATSKPVGGVLLENNNTQSHFKLSEAVGQSFLVGKKKEPSSLLGSGSSVASTSDHSEVSDLESNSGIETSNPTATSPKVGVALPLSLSPKNKKGQKNMASVQSCNNLGVAEGLDEASDIRIDSFIKCLDIKVTKDMLSEKAIQLLRLIPDMYIPLPHQVGGHKHVSGKLGFLRKLGEDHLLLKPVPLPNGPREVMFYKKVFESCFNENSKDIQIFRELIPKYHGPHYVVDRAGKTHKYTQLEDIVSKFHKPCIMDLKIGRRVWDDHTCQEKIEREKKRYPQQEVIGFKIIGMRIYRESTREYVYYDKVYGRSVTAAGMLDSLRKFFTEGDVSRSDVIGPIIERLRYILHLLERQKLYRFFGTSALIVYEGDTKCPIRKPKDLLDIRLVDFAHTYECNTSNEPDHNTIFGLSNLIKYLEQLQTDSLITH